MSCTIKPNKTKIMKLVGNQLLVAESKQDRAMITPETECTSSDRLTLAEIVMSDNL